MAGLTGEQHAALLAELREAVKDKKPHADYLETLIAYYEQGGSEEDEPTAPDGVSWRIETALSSDVTALHRSRDCTREYIKARKASRLASARGRRSREQSGPQALRGLLHLDGP